MLYDTYFNFLLVFKIKMLQKLQYTYVNPSINICYSSAKLKYHQLFSATILNWINLSQLLICRNLFKLSVTTLRIQGKLVIFFSCQIKEEILLINNEENYIGRKHTLAVHDSYMGN